MQRGEVSKNLRARWKAKAVINCKSCQFGDCSALDLVALCAIVALTAQKTEMTVRLHACNYVYQCIDTASAFGIRI